MGFNMMQKIVRKKIDSDREALNFAKKFGKISDDPVLWFVISDKTPIFKISSILLILILMWGVLIDGMQYSMIHVSIFLFVVVGLYLFRSFIRHAVLVSAEIISKHIPEYTMFDADIISPIINYSTNPVSKEEWDQISIAYREK